MTVPIVQAPPQREPIFNVPVVILALVGLFTAIHLGRSLLSPDADFRLILDYAFVPARFDLYLPAEQFAAQLAQSVRELPPEAAQLQVSLGELIYAEGGFKPWTVLTYAALHATWMHLLVNCAWLLAFGSPVARRFGVARFLGFFAVCSAAGALAHFITHDMDVMPMVGASGAISGCMAAAARFIFQRGGMFGGDRASAYLAPAEGLLDFLRDRRALLFVLVWFAINFIFGIAATPLGMSDAAVAWQAHIGGFLAGLLLFPLFDPIPRAVRA